MARRQHSESRFADPRQVAPSSFWTKVTHTAGRVPFVEEVVAAYFAMRDPATPWRHKAVLAGAIAYFVLPLDAVPDFILPMGYADDAAAIAAAMAAASISIRDVHRQRARRVLGTVVEAETTIPGEVVDHWGADDPAQHSPAGSGGARP